MQEININGYYKALVFLAIILTAILLTGFGVGGYLIYDSQDKSYRIMSYHTEKLMEHSYRIETVEMENEDIADDYIAQMLYMQKINKELQELASTVAVVQLVTEHHREVIEANYR